MKVWIGENRFHGSLKVGRPGAVLDRLRRQLFSLTQNKEVLESQVLLWACPADFKKNCEMRGFPKRLWKRDQKKEVKRGRKRKRIKEREREKKKLSERLRKISRRWGWKGLIEGKSIVILWLLLRTEEEEDSSRPAAAVRLLWLPARRRRQGDDCLRCAKHLLKHLNLSPTF